MSGFEEGLTPRHIEEPSGQDVFSDSEKEQLAEELEKLDDNDIDSVGEIYWVQETQDNDTYDYIVGFKEQEFAGKRARCSYLNYDRESNTVTALNTYRYGPWLS